MERRQDSDQADEALDLIRDIREAGVSPDASSKLDELARLLTRPASTERPAETAKPRRQFGAFAGKFAIGPEFFDPLSEAERQAWEEN